MIRGRNGVASTPKPIQTATASPNSSLPPPPTQSRTIIKRKPKAQHSETNKKRLTSLGSTGSAEKTNEKTSATGNKQPSSTNIAGKKIARKTAHSNIERRRRPKVNEEFGVLKAMIPVCTYQEMHQLAILQVRLRHIDLNRNGILT